MKDARQFLFSNHNVSVDVRHLHGQGEVAPTMGASRNANFTNNNPLVVSFKKRKGESK